MRFLTLVLLLAPSAFATDVQYSFLGPSDEALSIEIDGIGNVTYRLKLDAPD